jgi:hypothetical protein
MATREEFLAQLWRDVINAPMRGHWIGNAVRGAERRPDAPFADLGPAAQRLLALGAEPHDLSLIARWASYDAVFQVLYMLDDPGVDDDDNKMMHEELLRADPSGLEGRPGSAPRGD